MVFIFRHLHGNSNSSGLIRGGVLTEPALAIGGAAQFAAAHCPNQMTLDPAVCRSIDPHILQPAALWPSPRNVLLQRLSIIRCAGRLRIRPTWVAIWFDPIRSKSLSKLSGNGLCGNFLLLLLRRLPHVVVVVVT